VRDYCSGAYILPQPIQGDDILNRPGRLTSRSQSRKPTQATCWSLGRFSFLILRRLAARKVYRAKPVANYRIYSWAPAFPGTWVVSLHIEGGEELGAKIVTVSLR